MDEVECRHAGLSFSRIGYGCASFAGWDRAAPDAEQVHAGRTAVEAALAQGITLFDHADIYGFGHAEALFGQILRERPGMRDAIVIQTKCGQRLADDWSTTSGGPIGIDLSHDHIVTSVEGSLARLGVERIDILLLHTPSPLAEPEEIAHAFDRLHADGKVRAFGTSNFLPGQLALLERTLDQPLAVNQVQISFGHPHALCDGMDFPLMQLSGRPRTAPLPGMGGVLDHCRLRDIQVQAWSPLRGTQAAPGSVLARLAEKLGATPYATGLAWLMRHPAGIVPIIGATNPVNIADNAAAARLAIGDEDWISLLHEAIANA
jgi:predicted oxidoreductase